MKSKFLKNHKGEPMTVDVWNRQKSLARRFSVDDWGFLCSSEKFLDATLESQEAAEIVAHEILTT